MKKIITVALFAFAGLGGSAQDFLGLSTGNFSGVTGVSLQPASIVDSRHKFDINLISTDVTFKNNYFLVDRDALLKFNSKNFSNWNTFQDKYIRRSDMGNNQKMWFDVNNRTQLPLSFMATMSPKSAIALNLQSRTMLQGRGIQKELADLAYNKFYPLSLAGSSVNASGYRLDGLNWLEAGLTYGRVIFNSDKHFLKGAITAKYLGGINSVSMGSDNFTMGVNADSSFNITTSNHRYNRNEGVDFDMVFDKNFRPDANSWGFDAGLVYEFRGNIDKFRYISRDDQQSFLRDRRDVNKYMFKLGVSLLDVGKFTFNKPDYVRSFDGTILGWDLRGADYKTLREFDEALASKTTESSNDVRSYAVHLPTALSVQFDLRFIKGFYLNAMAYRPLNVNVDGYSEGFKWDNYGYYAIVPRWESRHLGIYLPYTFGDHKNITSYKANNLGATVRLGPVFVGSSNLGTVAFNKELDKANVHLGLKVGITYGKPNRVSRAFDKATGAATYDRLEKREGETFESAGRKAEERTIIDYKNGKIITGSSNRGDIIIINNYYDKAPGANVSEVRVIRRDSLNPVTDSVYTEYIQAQDSLQIKKMQLDSLIRNLEEMRIQLERGTSERPSAAITGVYAEKQVAAAPDPKKKRTNSNRETITEAEERYNETLRRYAAEASELRSDIGRLNNRLRRLNSELPGSSLARSEPVENIVTQLPAYRAHDSVVIVRDTIYQRVNTFDTLYRPGQPIIVRDTIRLTPDPVTVVKKEQPDYTVMPADVVLFDVGSSTIKLIYHDRLNFLADILKTHSSLRAKITGHTDKTGSRLINEQLSRQRADAVKNYFEAQGVDAEKLDLEAAGPDDPAVEGSERSALSQNRRVTIKLFQ